jgi:hypothetical protein
MGKSYVLTTCTARAHSGALADLSDEWLLSAGRLVLC